MTEVVKESVKVNSDFTLFLVQRKVTENDPYLDSWKTSLEHLEVLVKV